MALGAAATAIVGLGVAVFAGATGVWLHGVSQRRAEASRQKAQARAQQEIERQASAALLAQERADRERAEAAAAAERERAESAERRALLRDPDRLAAVLLERAGAVTLNLVKNESVLASFKVQRWKENARDAYWEEGDFIVTTKRLRFDGPGKDWTKTYANIAAWRVNGVEVIVDQTNGDPIRVRGAGVLVDHADVIAATIDRARS